jgi:hypothetical protein
MLIPTEGKELHLAAFGDNPEELVQLRENEADWDPYTEITFYLFTRLVYNYSQV